MKTVRAASVIGRHNRRRTGTYRVTGFDPGGRRVHGVRISFTAARKATPGHEWAVKHQTSSTRQTANADGPREIVDLWGKTPEKVEA